MTREKANRILDIACGIATGGTRTMTTSERYLHNVLREELESEIDDGDHELPYCTCMSTKQEGR